MYLCTYQKQLFSCIHFNIEKSDNYDDRRCKKNGVYNAKNIAKSETDRKNRLIINFVCSCCYKLHLYWKSPILPIVMKTSLIDAITAAIKTESASNDEFTGLMLHVMDYDISTRLGMHAIQSRWKIAITSEIEHVSLAIRCSIAPCNDRVPKHLVAAEL